MSVQQGNLLEGKTIAAGIREQIMKDVESFVAQGLSRPGLMAIQTSDDPSSTWYINQQQKWAEKLGIHFERLGTEKVTSEKELFKQLDYYGEGNNDKIHGIFLAMPLAEGFNTDEALLRLDPKKDVEGIHPTSLGLIVLRKAKLIPPTAYAAFSLIEATGVELRGKKAVIVGQSAIVGRPLQLLLGQNRVTTTVCNTGTSEETMRKLIAETDIVVACAGSPGMIKGDWISEGQIVIDVGTTEVDGQLVGDVEFEKASQKASYITPVPGGVGPLTVTMLMQNLLHAYRWQKNLS